MVWSGCGSSLQGSPLDLLPLPPSALPMPHMDSPITEEHRRLVSFAFTLLYYYSISVAKETMLMTSMLVPHVCYKYIIALYILHVTYLKIM